MYREPRHVLNDRGVLVMLTLLALLSFVTLLVDEALGEPSTPCEEADRVETKTETDLEPAIRWLLRGVRSSDPRHERAPRLASLIAQEAEYYGISPQLLLATLFAESSLRLGRVGEARNEVGMGQLHGQALLRARRELQARGVNVNELDGQIAASAWLLSDSRQICGDLPGAITRYISGRCNSSGERVSKKVRHRLILVQKLEKIK
jgi:hypothetical protein